MDDITMFTTGLQIANLGFLWSLHARVTKMQERQEACIFCKSDTSADEFKRMKHPGAYGSTHTDLEI